MLKNRNPYLEKYLKYLHINLHEENGDELIKEIVDLIDEVYDADVTELLFHKLSMSRIDKLKSIMNDYLCLFHKVEELLDLIHEWHSNCLVTKKNGDVEEVFCHTQGVNEKFLEHRLYPLREIMLAAISTVTAKSESYYNDLSLDLFVGAHNSIEDEDEAKSLIKILKQLKKGKLACAE
jgi:hypothetical protein